MEAIRVPLYADGSCHKGPGHTAAPGDIFIGKIWNSVNKWFMAGGETEDLVVTNGCYRVRIKKEKQDKLPDLIAGLCSEAYRVQMRGFARVRTD